MCVKGLVVKSNELVSIPHFNGEMEQKLFARMILMVREDKEKGIYSIPLKQISEDFGFDPKNFNHLRDVANKMCGPIDQSTEDTIYVSAGLFEKIYTEDVSLFFVPSQALKPHILELAENFTAYCISAIVSLRSKYSIRLFEVLKMNSFRKNVVYDLDVFKTMLGVAPGKLVKYGHFKTRCLLPAKKEVEEKGGISFILEEKKTGRAVTGIVLKEIIAPKKISNKNNDSYLGNIVKQRELVDLIDINPRNWETKRSFYDKLSDNSKIQVMKFFWEQKNSDKLFAGVKEWIFFYMILEDGYSVTEDVIQPPIVFNQKEGN